MVFLKNNLTFIWFLCVLTIAVFFRFWKISTIPFGLNNDAAWEGSAALAILGGNFGDYIPYAVEGWRGEGILRIVVAGLTLFFGNNPITIPFSSAIFGVGLIIVTFFLLRALFGDRLAILTSFFIAISGWHVTFSKTGWRAVTVPFFTTLVFYFFFKGLESKKVINFILAGTFLSIVSLYTYDAARVIPLFFIFWGVVEIFTRKSFLKIYAKHLVFLFISSFIFSLPMLWYAANNFENFKSRSDFLFVGHEIEKVGNFSPLINNITTSALLFNVKANGNDFFIFEPLVDEPVSYLLPIGFILTLYFVIFKKDKKYFFMLLWFLASLIPGILSVPNGNRAIGTVPSVYFFAALTLFTLTDFSSKRLSKYKFGYFSTVLVLIFCAYSLLLTYHAYLGPNRRELPGFYPETRVTTNYIKTIWDNYDIYLTDNYPRELLTYYLYKGGGNPFTRNYIWLEESLMFLNVNKNLRDKGLAFFMFETPANEKVAEDIIRKWGGGEKFLLWYENDNILRRPASLVVLISNK